MEMTHMERWKVSQSYYKVHTCGIASLLCRVGHCELAFIGHNHGNGITVVCYTHACMHMHTPTHTYTQTHTHTHKHECTHTHTLTHAHTNMHTPVADLWGMLIGC